MHFQLFYLAIFFCFAKALPEEKRSFLNYNLDQLKKSTYELEIPTNLECPNPEFYIQYANIEESNPSNRDKIILYHGETYGAWIFQMLWRAFLYPEAPDDWLPLRMKLLDTDIDKNTLLQLIDNDYLNDHSEEFTQIGLSVTPNLYSTSSGESAWGFICRSPFFNWHKVSGYSDHYFRRHQQLYDLLKEKFIPNDQWPKFSIQNDLLNFFIQEKRGLVKTFIFANYKEKFEKYFPDTFKQYQEEFDSFFDTVVKKVSERDFKYTEGVALQIIMEEELANQLTYNSLPLGAPKVGPLWKKEEVKYYSEAYHKNKNHKDYEQARLALNNDFRHYPSRVRIKAIAGIMENEVDYEIVKSMIREMVQFKKLEELEIKSEMNIEADGRKYEDEKNQDLEFFPEPEKQKKKKMKIVKKLKKWFSSFGMN